MSIKARFKLFIAGNTPLGDLAIQRVSAECQAAHGAAYHLSIIDVLEEPEQAEAEKILATPTLLKILPPPSTRMLGALPEGLLARRL